MTTPVSLRTAPDGFTEEWDRTTWNVGFVFRWSEFFQDWLDCRMMATVKPGQSLAESYEQRTGKPMVDGNTLFFATGF